MSSARNTAPADQKLLSAKHQPPLSHDCALLAWSQKKKVKLALAPGLV